MTVEHHPSLINQKHLRFWGLLRFWGQRHGPLLTAQRVAQAGHPLARQPLRPRQRPLPPHPTERLPPLAPKASQHPAPRSQTTLAAGAPLAVVLYRQCYAWNILKNTIVIQHVTELHLSTSITCITRPYFQPGKLPGMFRSASKRQARAPGQVPATPCRPLVGQPAIGQAVTHPAWRGAGSPGADPQGPRCRAGTWPDGDR